jgi:bifunctional non-homologous end joining protein LigD
MFNSFMGYNDVAHVKELSKEVTYVAAPKSTGNGRGLWYRAAKTGVAYQESFVLRDPLPVLAGSSARSTRPNGRNAPLPRSKQTFSHPKLLMWPGDSITKGDLIRYYDSIAPLLLPHIKNRPLMLERHPDGVGKRWFFQKDALPEETPARVTTQPIWSPSRDEGSRYISYHVGADRDQLLHFAQLCATTLHTWATTVDTLDYADTLILDLDPFNVPLTTVQQVALVAKEVLDELQLRGYLKTSGATGLHILVPLIPSTFSHDRVRLIAAAIAKLIVDRRPDIATIERMIRGRKGKVYVDFGQNGRGRTMASVYSPRARPGAPVSMPLRWEELNGPIDPEAFTIRTIFKRLERVGDLFATMSKDRQDIGPFCEALHA